MTYKPQQIVRSGEYNALAGLIAFPTPGTWDVLAGVPEASGGLAGGNQYIYYPAGIPGVSNSASVSAPPFTAHFFANARLFADALWSAKYNLPAGVAPWTAFLADAEMDLLVEDYDYLVFTDARSFYRLDIGSGVDDNTDFGVIRSRAYSAKITNVAGPGYPKEEDLFREPEVPVAARTYMNISIQAAQWIDITQSGPIR
jgi:hypothetical protein